MKIINHYLININKIKDKKYKMVNNQFQMMNLMNNNKQMIKVKKQRTMIKMKIMLLKRQMRMIILLMNLKNQKKWIKRVLNMNILQLKE